MGNYRKPNDDRIKEEVVDPNISYFTLFSYASPFNKLMIAIAMAASVIAALIFPYALNAVADIFQSMIDYEKTVNSGNKDADSFIKARNTFSLKYIFVGVVYLISGYLGSALMNLSAIEQVFKIRTAYLRAALHQDITYYDNTETKDFASRMADDIFKMEKGLGHNVSTFVYNLILGIASLVIAFVKGWKLTLVCLGPISLSLIVLAVMSVLIQGLVKTEAAVNAKASSLAEEVVSSIRTVYSFNAQRTEACRYAEYLGYARNIYIRKECCNGISIGFLWLCIFCAYALSFYFGVKFILEDPEHYTAHVMFAVLFGLITSAGYLGNVGMLGVSLAESRAAGAHIFKLLHNVPRINPLVDRGIVPTTAKGNVEFRNVFFRYPSRPEAMILKGFSFKVQPGQSVALVGYSGCGKSTVVQLISRFYDVFDGNILFDGKDVRELSVRWLRAQIGLVGQEPVLFNTTVRENIRYGREDASNADIEHAAKQANAHQFIAQLPQGYGTLVGEGGASFSGGQKQRIAIARALVRNPRLLLLDEATSALDSASEAVVQQALETASKGRTTITVAHRLSTIRNADVIIVLKDGELLESGSHNELMDMKGHYFEMMQREAGEPQTQITQDQLITREASIITNASRKSVLAVDEDGINKAACLEIMALNKPEWKSVAAGTISAIIMGFSNPIFLIMFGDLFGTLSSADKDWLSARVYQITLQSVLIGVLMAFFGFIQRDFFQYMAFGIAGGYLTERIRTKMFNHMLLQPVAYYDSPANSTGAMCARLSLEANYVRQALGQRVAVLLESLGMVGLSLIMAVYHEWRVTLLASLFTPLLVIVIYFQSKAAREESAHHSKTLQKSTKIAMDAVTNMRTVASLGREDKFVEEYMKQLEPALAPARISAHLNGIAIGISRSIFNFMNAAAMYYGGTLILNEGIPYKNILISTQAFQMASLQIQGAFTYMPDFQKGIGASSRVMSFLRLQPTMTDPVNPVQYDFQATGHAKFNNVQFSYPTRPSVQILKGLDLEIMTGKTVAVVGESGSGKSTIVKLLERFYDPSSGTVELDGVPLTSLLMSNVRRSYGLVSQEPVLFDRSLRENIAYGDQAQLYSQLDIECAAMQANIHSFIIALPKGYDTNIGSKGIQLSGGQKQRVAIARALVRHPKILLLDEATSALDTQSELVVQEALDRAKAGRTCVMIAHRLSTVRDADVIYVMHAGIVAETGTHEQLMMSKGLYYKLHSANKPNPVSTSNLIQENQS